MLEAINIHKKYTNGAKALQVLKGINVKIAKGAVVSIVGPSGAGKSTFLHILGGLDTPSDGKVVLNGEPLFKMTDGELSAARNRKIGFVFQFYHLFSEFSVLENVLLPARCGHVAASHKELKKKALQLLSEVGLTERTDHLPNQLSGGEKQRVALCRALINEPEFLLCDEPTGNLDTATGREVIDMIRRINKEKNMAVVVVTHNEEIARSADSMLHLQDGVIVN